MWTRTLATVGSSNASDPHGTTAENTWDFSKWTADAVVINLGASLGPRIDSNPGAEIQSSNRVSPGARGGKAREILDFRIPYFH